MNSLDTKKIRQWLIILISVVWLCFQLYIGIVKPFHPIIENSLHLLFALTIMLLYNPITITTNKKWLWFYDMFLYAGIITTTYYILSQSNRLQLRVLLIDPMLPIDIICAFWVLIILLELVRRCVSKNLIIFILIFISYAALGKYLPGIFKYSGMNLELFSEMLLLSPDGILGSPIDTSVDTLFYFMLFSAFLSASGAGDILLDCGMKLSNKTYGGPAKAAVVSSSLTGMVSGSATANVSTTGVFTIPLMKKVGYTPIEAGAIEAVASSGGQLMPPIMGVGAFLMAEMTGIPYLRIAISAILPSLAYYISVFVLVDFLARRKKVLKSDEAQAVFETEPILPRLYQLTPLLVLIFMIVEGYSLSTTALYATGSCIIIGMFNKKKRMSPKRFLDSVIQGVKQAAEIAIPTAACGIMIGIVVRSGGATKIARVISQVGGDNITLALVIAMFGCILLGMALPTSAAYLMSNVLFCPTLVSLGIPILTANMFVFYFGIFAHITPPVCLASYAAAGIAGADSWKTGWTAFTYSLVGFLVPYVFAFKPEILMIGEWQVIIKSFIIMLVGIIPLCAGLSGYLFMPINQIWIRASFVIISILTIIPETLTTQIGLILTALTVMYFFIRSRDQKKAISV